MGCCTKCCCIVFGVIVALAVVAAAVAAGVVLGRKQAEKDKNETTPETWTFTSLPPPVEAPQKLADSDRKVFHLSQASYQRVQQLFEGSYDSSQQPCQDFYAHACGNYRNPSGVARAAAWSRMQSASISMQERVKAALGELKEGEGSVANQYLAKFYKECQDPSRLSSSATYIQGLVRAFGDSVLLNSSAVAPSNPYAPLFDVQTYSAADAFLRLSVDADFLVKSQNALTLQFYPPSSTQIFNAILGLYGYSRAVLNKAAPFNIQTLTTEMVLLSQAMTSRWNEWNLFYLVPLSRIRRDAPEFASALIASVPILESVSNPRIWTNLLPADIKEFGSLISTNSRPAQAQVVGSFLGAYFDSTGYKAFVQGQNYEFILGKRFALSSSTNSDACIRGLFLQQRPFLTWALTRLVTDKFGPHSADVERLARMVDHLKSSMKDRIQHQDWLDSASMGKAVEKLDALVPRLVYPSWIHDDTSLAQYYGTLVAPSEGMSFVEAATRVWFDSWEERIGGLARSPLPKEAHWSHDFSTLVTNAFYAPMDNTINILLGILQEPIFREDYPPALLYGMIGSVVGHEITHGFDSSGVNYDKDGVQNPWLSAESEQKFEKKADCFVEEYDTFCYPEYGAGECVDGVKTLGENIADRGGLDVSFHAYRALLSSGAESQYAIPGELSSVTVDQQFYLSFGNVWCSHLTQATLVAELQTDEHSPAPSRVNGTLQNVAQFSYSFFCQPGTPMNPPKRCELW